MEIDPYRPRREARRRARDAVDSKRARDVFARGAEEQIEPDDEAAEPLKAAPAEETANVTEVAARRARRYGGKTVTSEDVAQANQRRQDRQAGNRSRKWTSKLPPDKLHGD